MFDEGRQVGGSGERKPVHGEAVGAGDRGEGAPFVDGEVSSRELVRVGAAHAGWKHQEKCSREEAEWQEMKEPQATGFRCQGFH